jgi:DNA-directed RNA polymerase subunit RPC12/RpoP
MKGLSIIGGEGKVKQEQVYALDLTRMEGNGDFACPKCGFAISPEDESEAVYSILEAKVEKQSLKELLIQCNRCASQIHLTGFSLLQKLRL